MTPLKLEQNMIRQRLSDSALFRNVYDSALPTILDAAHQLDIDQGQYVFRQGESARGFYLVVSGEAELTVNMEDGEPLIVGRIRSGGHFGETSLLNHCCHATNARALTDLILAYYEKEIFQSLLLANTAISQQLCCSLAQRLRVSFHDHAGLAVSLQKKTRGLDHNLDSTFFVPPPLEPGGRKGSNNQHRLRLPESTLSRQIANAVIRFTSNLEPVLLTGETGTGRRMIAHEIHRAGIGKGPYVEMDIRSIDPMKLEEELFGYDQEDPAFTQIDQLGLFERLHGGTVVLYNAERLEPDFQRQLASILRKKTFSKIGGEALMTLRTRIILICTDAHSRQDGQNRLLPELYSCVAKQYFQAAPLRMHRRDIPRLVHYYLKRYNRQYGKNITQVDDRTMGMFMNYEWPGNLTEMASVIQRAVIIGRNNEALTDQMLLGVPRSEGKWEFNLLRLHRVHRFITSRYFPALPRAIMGIFFIMVLLILFFGPENGEKNIGLTLSWVVGWPLLIFAFFFFARTWCSVCGLSFPGWVAQHVLKPQRPTPQLIRHASGWIMTILCIILFWIEIAWDAYQSPRLTAWIIFTITLGALFCSMLYKRRVWCRYLCPLGAINALFSMPSILELRSNTHMCLNRCTDHLCYTGDGGSAGCPMFRHPFLVDNNRDCILCGQCIKNCRLNSIHLNLRLAPQELWNQQSPRLEDSVLVVSLAAIFFPFTIHHNAPDAVAGWLALPDSPALAATFFFFA
ncbi:MAG: sigma 54-interacting transcriptional regulator, partial [Desulfopila sp.]|nr:sigma 54-interacting transcriptional regulator [Desulfopila sp.]